MKTLKDYNNEMFAKIRQIEKKEKGLIVTESTVIDLYVKLVNKEDCEDSEKDAVLKRFKELTNYTR